MPADSDGGVSFSLDAGKVGKPPTMDPGTTPDSEVAPGAGDTSPTDPSASIQSVNVRLVPQAGVSGTQRVNFAVPLPRNLLHDAGQLSVWAADSELVTGRRVLAQYADGSARSIQIQADLDISRTTLLDVRVGEPARLAPLSLVPVADTLMVADGTKGPKVWALMSADWLSASGVLGSLLPENQASSHGFGQWGKLCNYEAFDVDTFLAQMSSADVWLYDRGTTHYRGYARVGDLVPLETAYRETALYRAQLTGTGTATRIGVPGKANDLKYHYAQNLAAHYLLSGDDRFRESAEDIATRVAALWPNPAYSGGAQFWTERHAGFSLLAYVWAALVSDDRQSEFMNLADAAVRAYIDVQNKFPSGYADNQARCFAHDAVAHGESFGYFGCSPWMSAILADALDAYATERGGTAAQTAREAIVKLGKILARDGRDSTGRPYYWMGVGNERAEPDTYNEHWGEGAYVLAMAWHHGGRTDETLHAGAVELAEGFGANGVVPHVRSFNWQCRSAVATSYYLF